MKSAASFAPTRAALLGLALVFFAPLLSAAPKYLRPDTIDPIVLLAPPPEPGSMEDAADLETAFRVYSARTPAERARAVSEDELTIFHFAPAIGPWFAPGKFPKTEALFKEVEAESKGLTSPAKKYWKRIRPYHKDPARFTDPVEREDRTDYSYPSGHSTRGTTYALLLAELFPEKREALLAKGRDTGWLRVLGGVHHPTDIYAGRVLGQAYVRALLQNEAFQHDLAEAKAELAAGEAAAVKPAEPATAAVH